METNDLLKVALSQMAPVWLNKEKTTVKVIQQIKAAANQGCRLVVFGEGLLPGYPFWLSEMMASKFNDAIQKDIYAHYLDHGVQIAKGDLDGICKTALQHKIAVYLGTIERAADRGNHSLYCSLVYISPEGKIESVQRKLMPTYDERLVWSIGDGNGLRTHHLDAFKVGGLNCWENWMPLPRAALYAQGETLHVAVWPGSVRNTVDITRFIAQESRSYVISVSGLMSKKDLHDELPHIDLMRDCFPDVCANGGSCIAAPDGSWLLEPQQGEGLFVATLDPREVRRERHNFDPSGHYSRPDVLQLQLNRERQSVLKIKDVPEQG